MSERSKSPAAQPEPLADAAMAAAGGTAIPFVVRGEYIQLDHLLKAAGLVASGGAAHAEVEQGKVRVDGRLESRKRAKLRPGQRVDYDGQRLLLVAAQPN